MLKWLYFKVWIVRELDCITNTLGLSNGGMCQMITPFEPRSYTDCTFRRWWSGVRSSRSVVSDPLHLHEVIRGLSVGEVPFLMSYCYIVLLRDFLDSSLCTAATMANCIGLYPTLRGQPVFTCAVGVTLDVPRSFLASPNTVVFEWFDQNNVLCEFRRVVTSLAITGGEG
jgi:hypothetical protein